MFGDVEEWYYLHIMKTQDATQSVRLSRDIVRSIKRYIIDNGGTIRSVLEEGAVIRLKKFAKKKN